MALLLWANLTGIALFIGIAFAAQLEAIRVAKSGPATPYQKQLPKERINTDTRAPRDSSLEYRPAVGGSGLRPAHQVCAAAPMARTSRGGHINPGSSSSTGSGR